MKEKHTPGPWEIDDVLNQLDEEYDGQDIVISKEGCPIATVRGTDDMSCIDDDEELYRIALEVQANSRLMATAPELLNCLIDARELLKDWGIDEEAAGHALLHHIDTVIRKATE